jgi:hypothetical protein
MAADFEITDAMRAVIGVESDPYPVEFTSTGIRAFARGVGYDDLVYYDVAAAKAAGYANLPAPPCYLGIPIFIPGESDPTYGNPRQGGARLDHGLKNVLDGGTDVTYNRVPVAGETLMSTSQVAGLEVKESKGIGRMLVVTTQGTFRHPDTGEIYMTTRGQGLFY